jgi:circadian clock protein KaiB
MNEQVVLTLYIAGANPRSERAIENLRQIGDAFFAGRCLIQIVDVLRRPEAAESARIMATPTLVREQPQPERRIIGDLSDQDTVLKALSIAFNGEV